MNGGVTVREMAAGIQYVGNGGLFYEPYTYYYVTDQNGTVILDNRNNVPLEAYSPDTAYVMNRLLRYNVLTSQHSHSMNANVSGWEIVGKTGTTDDDKDSWFVGASPYCTLAVWTGYDTPDSISVTSTATTTWRRVMTNYLADKEYKEFDKPDSIISATYCKGSGLLAASGCSDTGTGYYTQDTMPDYCGGYHIAFTGSSSSSSSSKKSSSKKSSDSDKDETQAVEETTAPTTAVEETTAETTAPEGGDGGGGDTLGTIAPPNEDWVIE